MKKTIGIKMRDGITREKVTAEIVGKLAAHEMYNVEGKYTVTHPGYGFRIPGAEYDSMDDAIVAAEVLDHLLDLSGLKFTQVEEGWKMIHKDGHEATVTLSHRVRRAVNTACEIVEIKKVSRDTKKGEEYE